VLVVVLVLALAGSLSRHQAATPDPERAAAPASSASPPSATPTTPEPTSTPRRVVRIGHKAVPGVSPAPRSEGFVSCDANVRVKASTTTCPFAQNVFYEYYRETNGVPQTVTVQAWSPAASRDFDVTCSGTESIVCRADDGARVRFPARAVLAYDDQQAERFASSRETGTTEDAGGASIPNYENGTGYRVECADGMYSRSGGRPGACSGHGGVAAEPDVPDLTETYEPDYGSGDEIPNYDNGTGSRVQCADGMYSQSGGRPGACSGHGGVG
jgi:hypothetical protein